MDVLSIGHLIKEFGFFSWFDLAVHSVFHNYSLIAYIFHTKKTKPYYFICVVYRNRC
jgi:hypothetical protein